MRAALLDALLEPSEYQILPHFPGGRLLKCLPKPSQPSALALDTSMVGQALQDRCGSGATPGYPWRRDLAKVTPAPAWDCGSRAMAQEQHQRQEPGDWDGFGQQGCGWEWGR